MRVLAGYWTHGGYLNWDTGFGFERWHQAKKLGLSQQALIGIASAPALAPRRAAPAWAKWMLDRGFGVYERQLARNGGEPPGLLFGVNAVPQQSESARLGARADDLQRGPRDRRRARLRAGAQAAVAVLVRPRHGPAGGHDARVQHGDRAERPPRVSVRRDRSRAALRRAPGGRGRDRRPPAGIVRAARARRRRPPEVRHPAPGPRPAVAHAGAARRPGAGLRLDGSRLRRPVPRPARERAWRAARGWTGRTSHRFTPELRADELDAVGGPGRAGGRRSTCCSRAGARTPA